MILCQPSMNKSIRFLLAASCFRSGVLGGVLQWSLGIHPGGRHTHFILMLTLRGDREPINQNRPRATPGRHREYMQRSRAGQPLDHVTVVNTEHTSMQLIHTNYNVNSHLLSYWSDEGLRRGYFCPFRRPIKGKNHGFDLHLAGWAASVCDTVMKRDVQPFIAGN